MILSPPSSSSSLDRLAEFGSSSSSEEMSDESLLSELLELMSDDVVCLCLDFSCSVQSSVLGSCLSGNR